MLREAVAELEKRRPRHELLPPARALLAGAADRVLTASGATISKGQASPLRWQVPRDRDPADAVRIEIGELLEKLKQ